MTWFGKKETAIGTSEPVITMSQHNEIVRKLVGSILEISSVISVWSSETVMAAHKSNNEAVVKFANQQMLTLKKKVAETLHNEKIQEGSANDRVQ